MGNDIKKSGRSAGGSSQGEGEHEENPYPFVPKSHRIKNIWDLFKEEKTLGEGASCSVSLARYRGLPNGAGDEDDGGMREGTKVALKIMKQQDKWNPMLFKQEVAILTTLKHTNILEYRCAYIDVKNFYFGTALLEGGELFDRIKALKHFNEEQAQVAMKQIVSAMAHCHSRNIVHRDLKPENIVYKWKQGHTNDRGEDVGDQLCIIDFGDAKVVNDNEVYDDFVGTAFYLAPEVVRNRQGWELKASDMWTIGVICYVLVTGRPPFWGRDNREILKKILKGRLVFPKKLSLSRETKQFIKQLVVKNPGDRLTGEQALDHPWLGGTGAKLPEKYQAKLKKKRHKKKPAPNVEHLD